MGAAHTADSLSLTLSFKSGSSAALHYVLDFLTHHDTFFSCIFTFLKYMNNFLKAADINIPIG